MMARLIRKYVHPHIRGYFLQSRPCFWALLFLVISFPVWFTAVLNFLGPSTEYHEPHPATAARGADGRLYVYLGDEFYVNITIVRHKINGNCRFKIVRYAEYINGSLHGRRLPISYAELQFVGQNELRRARWPSPPDRYILGYAVDENNVPQHDKPLLPNGVDEYQFRFYVVGRYYCNFLDYIIPRYIQGGDNPDETPSVRLFVRRHKP